MNKLLSIAIMGFLLLSVSAVSTVSAAGADDVGFDNSRNRVSDDSPGSDDSTSTGGSFSTPTDNRNGASKPEDNSGVSDDSTSAGGSFSTPTDERNGASKPEDNSGVSDDSMSTGGSFSTPTDERNGASKPEDNSGVSNSSTSVGGSSSTSTDRRRGADKPEDDTMRISNSHNSEFEGIWNLDGQGANWVGVTVSGNKIIMLKYEPEHLSSALAGSVVGNVAFLGFSVDASSFEATLTLTSSTTAILKVISCNSKSDHTCSFSDDDSFSLTKVFE